MIVANRNAAGVYRPVPKPVANGTLKSIAEMGAAPVTPTKITPHRPMALGFRRSTPESPAYTDSTVPSWRAPIPESGLVVAMLPLTLQAVLRGQSCPTTAGAIEPSRPRARKHWARSSAAVLEHGVGHEAAHDPVKCFQDLADLLVS